MHTIQQKKIGGHVHIQVIYLRQNGFDVKKYAYSKLQYISEITPKISTLCIQIFQQILFFAILMKYKR